MYVNLIPARFLQTRHTHNTKQNNVTEQFKTI